MGLSPTQGHDSESTVLTCFSILFALGPINSADAAPMRPVTFVVDTRLSEGPVENFTDLAVDPYKLVTMLQPTEPAGTLAKTAQPVDFSDENAAGPLDLAPLAAPLNPTGDASNDPSAVPATAPIVPNGKGDLLIPNERSYTATVAVNDTVVGDLGPYTAGAIHNIPSGTYTVSFTHTSGYTYIEKVTTTQLSGAIVPGGRGAAVVLPNQGAPAEQ